MTTDTVDRKQVEQIAAQIGSSLMPDSHIWVNRFTVKSTSSSTLYTVAQRRSDGVWGCSCLGWTRNRKCKHRTDILHRLAKVAEAARGELDAAVLAMLTSARTAYLDLGDVAPVAVPKTRGRDLDL